MAARMKPEQQGNDTYRKDRNSWLGWFFAIQIGVPVIYYLSVYNSVSQGFRPGANPWFLPIGELLATVCAMIGLHSWAKYKGQDGRLAFLGLLNLIGVIIGAIILSPKPVKSLNEKPIAQPQVAERKSEPIIPPARNDIPAVLNSETITILERYSALKEKGLITEDEYNQQKKKLLGL